MARTRRLGLAAGLLILIAALASQGGPSGGPLSPSTAHAAEESFDGASASIKKQLDSSKPDERKKGYQRLGAIRDPKAFDLVLVAAERERARAAALAAAQTETETKLEAAVASLEKLKGEPPPTNGQQTDDFNKRSRKLQKAYDDLVAKQTELGLDVLQQKAVSSAFVAAAAAVLELLPRAISEPLLQKLADAWNGPKSPLEDRLRWVDVLAAVHIVPTGDTLRAVALDVAGEVHVRAAAIEARAQRLDPGTVEDCLQILAEGQDRFPVVFAAIDSLRRLHRREAIEPLIEFMGRVDVGRLRGDALTALRSLTGQKHGPYRQPWADWWKDAKEQFQMPEKPADVTELARPDKGVTFFSITTFSEHLLFVLDVSGSMKDPAHPDAAGSRAEERRIDLLRKELSASLAMLDDKKTFDVVFFSHRVFRLLGVISPATKPTVERARKFANELEPTGATNICDALEMAFRIAGASTSSTTGGDVTGVDTVFFMTDGKPTAGKQQDPERILELVRDWNRHAHITIHAIAMGDESDDKFLQALASQNGGQYVKR